MLCGLLSLDLDSFAVVAHEDELVNGSLDEVQIDCLTLTILSDFRQDSSSELGESRVKDIALKVVKTSLSQTLVSLVLQVEPVQVGHDLDKGVGEDGVVLPLLDVLVQELVVH